MLLAAAIVLSPAPPPRAPAKTEPWAAAIKRGDFESAATLLQRLVFEPARGSKPDADALKQLALLYVDGKGVEKDPVLGCGLLRAHAVAAATGPRATAAAKRGAQAIVDRYCSPLSPIERAAAFAAMSCPRVGLQRGATVALEPGWTIQFNDRSATVARNGQVREQPLAGNVLCRSQVLLVRHSALSPASHGREVRHVIELVTVQSGWHGATLSREMVWQLYEVRGLALDLAAVQRWQDTGSAWPAPPLPDSLAHGANFSVQPSGEIEYLIPDEPPRKGTVASQQAVR